jgi:hypothetical protein
MGRAVIRERSLLLPHHPRHGVWVPAFAGTTLSVALTQKSGVAWWHE